ncbi:MAG: hypothetical protein AB1689_14175 [Thermodesulfobacteriota bacterium]
MRRSASLLAAAALVALPSAVAATTYVLPSDAALADRAELIARVRVDSFTAAPGRAALDYAVTLERVLKGERTGTLTVRVPGNPAPRHGHALRVDGAPELRPGQRALLFLHPNDDGTFRVVHLVLGAFVETRAHDDGRGALLLASDKAAVCALYPDVRLTPAECAQR